MSDRVLITVCVPTYNGAAYLVECLDSILAQTRRDFELLVVDDGSADDTVAIAQGYAARDARVRVERNPHNLGLTGNWARCIELARGQWIKFVFQDDLIEPDCLQQMMAAALAGHPMVACARDFIFEVEPGQEEGVRRGYRRNQELIADTFSGGNHLSADAYCRALLRRPYDNLVGEPTCVLMHRGVFERFGRFHEHMITLCDAEYWNRVAVHLGVYRLPGVLAWFRVHGSATSALNQARRHYRNNQLDGLLMVHDFAFEPVYAPLRQTAAQLRPPADLAAIFWQRTLEAWWWAKNSEIADPRFAPMREWEQVSQLYPRLNAVPLEQQVRAKWHAIKKTLAGVLAR